MHIVDSPDYLFTTIDHKFMVSGHSYLPNDRGFGNIETAKRRGRHIYVPEDWYTLVHEAHHQNAFSVKEMQPSDFVSLKDLAAVVNRKTNTH